MSNIESIRKSVEDHYGKAARQVSGPAGCGPSSGCCETVGLEKDPITRDLYNSEQLEGLPDKAFLASLGCGNPTALAELKAGEVVLDLGSGGGIDVLLSAKRVGPTGKAYGLDMTDDMLQLARANAAEAGATNVEFLRGHIEEIPLPSETVDVIISNCVINLSGDKDAVLREAFRVLKPGGRFAVSDVVLEKALPENMQAIAKLWSGCVTGALIQDDYRKKLENAGFIGVELEATRRFSPEEADEMLQAFAPDVREEATLFSSSVLSAFIRAKKPLAKKSQMPKKSGGCCNGAC